MDLTQEQWQSQSREDDQAVLIDVRTDEEWEAGMIPGAMHLDIYKPQEFMNGLEKLDRSKKYYVYCKAGGRSHQACSIMSQLGFLNTFNLLGGITEWKGPVEIPE